jgi:hypothetical protein
MKLPSKRGRGGTLQGLLKFSSRYLIIFERILIISFIYVRNYVRNSLNKRTEKKGIERAITPKQYGPRPREKIPPSFQSPAITKTRNQATPIPNETTENPAPTPTHPHKRLLTKIPPHKIPSKTLRTQPIQPNKPNINDFTPMNLIPNLTKPPLRNIRPPIDDMKHPVTLISLNLPIIHLTIPPKNTLL